MIAEATDASQINEACLAVPVFEGLEEGDEGMDKSSSHPTQIHKDCSGSQRKGHGTITRLPSTRILGSRRNALGFVSPGISGTRIRIPRRLIPKIKPDPGRAETYDIGKTVTRYPTQFGGESGPIPESQLGQVGLMILKGPLIDGGTTCVAIG